MAKRTLNVTLAVVVDTNLMSVDSIIDNLKFNVEEVSENVEVAGGAEIVNFFEVECGNTTLLTPTEIKSRIHEALVAKENWTILLDEDTELYLFDDDTQTELGECFRVEGIYMNEHGDIYLSMDTAEGEFPREGWLLDDCTGYELQLIYDTFFGDE